MSTGKIMQADHASMHEIPDDVWYVLCAHHLSVDDVCSCRETCRGWRMVLVRHERVVAMAYARDVLSDHQCVFWDRAAMRPVSTRRSCRTWHQEVMRLRHFVNACLPPTCRRVEVFYEYLWPWLDSCA